MIGKMLIVLGFVLLSLTVNAQPITIHNGFVSGEQYLRMDNHTRRGYAMGLIDGIFLAPLLGGSEQRSSKLGTCIEGMTDAQLDAILSKFL